MRKSIRNSLFATSVLYLVLGALLILFPGVSLELFCALVGAVTLFYGGVRIVSYVKSSGSYAQRFDLFIGVLLGILGICLLVFPQLVVSVIPVTLGVYLLVDSFTAVRKSLDMKALGFEKWWIFLLTALALAVLSLVVIFNPFKLMSSFVVFLGCCFLFDGIAALVNTLMSSRL